MPIPLTSFPGEETNAAWSPDGRQVAFDWDGEKQDNADIYLIQPGSSQVLRLTTDPGSDKGAAWSPDGREIAYAHIAADGSAYSLNLVSPLGGPPRILFTSAALVGCPNWMPDGRALLFETAPEPKQPAVIAAIALDTGKRCQLTWPPAGTPGDLGPAISPDGRTLAFTRKTAWRTAELYLLDLKRDLSPAGTPRRVTDLGYVARPAWTPEGDRILFEAHREDTAIWQVDRSGKNAGPVFGVPNTASVPAIGRRPGGHMSLIFTNGVARFSIWRHNTERGPGGRPVELVPSTRSESCPRYSNDGKRLAFSSTRSGYQEIWVANADGSQPVQLTNLRHQLTEVGDWSPSDDLIAFVSQNRGSRQIYAIHASGGPAIQLTNETGVTYGSGWTRDGRAYYYFTLRSGKSEIWKAPGSGGQPEPIAQDAVNGFESQRGIFYYWRMKSGDDGPLMRRTAGRDEEVPLTPPACAACVTTPRREGVYYRTPDSSIYLFDESTGRSVRVLKRLPEPFNQFTVSPDGHWFATQLLTSQSVT